MAIISFKNYSIYDIVKENSKGALIMKKRKLLLLLIPLFLLTGCTNVPSFDNLNYPASFNNASKGASGNLKDYAVEQADITYDPDNTLKSSYVRLETKQFNQDKKALEKLIKDHQGKVSSLNLNTYKSSYDTFKTATYELELPKDQGETLQAKLLEEFHVSSFDFSMDDQTPIIEDQKDSLEALKAELEGVNQEIEDLEKVTSPTSTQKEKLDRLYNQKEAVEADIRYYKSEQENTQQQIATFHASLTLSEVQTFTGQQPSVFVQIKNNLRWIPSVFSGTITILLYLIVIAIPIFLLKLIIDALTPLYQKYFKKK